MHTNYKGQGIDQLQECIDKIKNDIFQKVFQENYQDVKGAKIILMTGKEISLSLDEIKEMMNLFIKIVLETDISTYKKGVTLKQLMFWNPEDFAMLARIRCLMVDGKDISSLSDSSYLAKYIVAATVLRNLDDRAPNKEELLIAMKRYLEEDLKKYIVN